MNRREFLRHMEAMSAAGVVFGAGAFSSGCIGFHYVSGSLAGGQLAVRRDAFGASPFVLVDHPGSALPLYIHQVEAGRFVAMSTRCRHRGCQVEPADGKLVCPCHGSEYDPEGRVLKGPTRLPLERFSVTTDDTHVMIDLRGDDPG